MISFPAGFFYWSLVSPALSINKKLVVLSNKKIPIDNLNSHLIRLERYLHIYSPIFLDPVEPGFWTTPKEFSILKVIRLRHEEI